MKVFIVRPFGVKTVYQKLKGKKTVTGTTYSFDQVEQMLIKPAMEAHKLTGGTTGEIFLSGEVREDMFSELLLADIVIADISIYNANVYYELGIRHSLRDKITILIKSRGEEDTPFDITGYKYVSYDREAPQNALADLVKFMGDSMTVNRGDSPVFNLLPLLESQDPEKYLAVPPDFTEEVTLAEAQLMVGKLALLADEAEYFNWKYAAWRNIGECLYRSKSFDLAKNVWERISKEKPHDLEANDRLATIYQRLADAEITTNEVDALGLYTQSDLAIGKLLAKTDLGTSRRAEAYALMARNAKTRWVNRWRNLAEPEWGAAAISSSFLQQACDYYILGFLEDQNHYYSGLNALGLLLVIIHLADTYPELWEAGFDTPAKATQQLQEYKDSVATLAVSVSSSIKAAQHRLEVQKTADTWVAISAADHACLTLDQPLKVSLKYKQVMETAKPQHAEAIHRQLLIYQQLGIKALNITAALAAVNYTGGQQRKRHYLLFTGHMIDQADRESPRFPADKEAGARAMIDKEIRKIKDKLPENTDLVGIAGGACGGDILFHELCGENSLSSVMYLALPKDLFAAQSVTFAGGDWGARFYALCAMLPHPYLMTSIDLPKWLQPKPDYDIWTRNNLWLLKNALIAGAENLSFIAFWDGEKGGGPGGTEHLASIAQHMGAGYVRIDSKKLLKPSNQ